MVTISHKLPFKDYFKDYSISKGGGGSRFAVCDRVRSASVSCY